MKRSDGAKAWSRVLSELAQVRVSVEWERPAWRVSWQDGPTREALMARAAALGAYRVGAPLPFGDLRFARSDSAVAVALAWLARGSPESPAAAWAAVAEVEAVCADTGYPRTRFDAGALAAAELLRRVGHGDIAEMGALLAQAVPPVAPADMLVPGPELIGRVVSSRWPVGGPPEELLGPAGHRPEAGSGGRTDFGQSPRGMAALRYSRETFRYGQSGVSVRNDRTAPGSGRRCCLSSRRSGSWWSGSGRRGGCTGRTAQLERH